MSDRYEKSRYSEESANSQQDIQQLADTLEGVLKSLGSDAKEEVDEARQNAKRLLKDVRNRMNIEPGGIKQAARNTLGNVDFYVYDKPWQSIGIGAAVGVVIGALLGCRR